MVIMDFTHQHHRRRRGGLSFTEYIVSYNPLFSILQVVCIQADAAIFYKIDNPLPCCERKLALRPCKASVCQAIFPKGIELQFILQVGKLVLKPVTGIFG